MMLAFCFSFAEPRNGGDGSRRMLSVSDNAIGKYRYVRRLFGDDSTTNSLKRPLEAKMCNGNE